MSSRWIVHCVLIFTQITFGISYVLNKVALNNGVNKIVFSIYRDSIAILLLAPLGFFIERGKRSSFSLSIACMVFVLGFLGVFSTQILLLTGLALTSPGFSSVFQSVTPVVAFVIAIAFRLEKIQYQRRDGQAKLLGVAACIAGAVVASLFKGETLNSSNVTVEFSSWNVGALCLVGNNFCMALYINLQAPILKRYPAPFSLTALSYICGGLILVITGALVVPSSAWRITNSIDAVAFVYAGLVTSGLNFALSTWCVHNAGPFLVIAYFPLQAVVSTFIAYVCLNESLFLGSVAGGVLIISGLYLVTWGQVQQKKLDASVTEPLIASVAVAGPSTLCD